MRIKDHRLDPIEKTAQHSLTELEKQLLIDFTHDDFFENGIGSTLWVDYFLEGTSSAPGRIARGILSSLEQKGYLWIDEHESESGDISSTRRKKMKTVMSLTDLAKEYLRELAQTDEDLARRIGE